jgi:hypothetical protein
MNNNICHYLSIFFTAKTIAIVKKSNERTNYCNIEDINVIRGVRQGVHITCEDIQIIANSKDKILINKNV